MLRIQVSLSPDTPHQEEAHLRTLAAKALGIPPERLLSVALIKKSVDARAGRPLTLRLTLDAQAKGEEALLGKGLRGVAPAPEQKPLPAPARLSSPPPRRPVVVGMGPAGLFAALALSEAGCPPLLIERGQPVERRLRDVEAFFAGGPLNPESNVQFGEGGAGTFSDGKLTTGIKDPRIRRVLETFVACGAPEDILYLSKPHIGTDRLRAMMPRLRGVLEAAGCEIRFGTRLMDLEVEAGALRAVGLSETSGAVSWIPCDQMVLAIGHSARDTLSLLRDRGLPMEAKPFSLGVRIEHPQGLIDRAQYGAFAGHPALGPADYKLAVHLPSGRDVYTFCMCPGGAVVAAASEAGGLCVNGMSPYARSLANANSALLVGVTPEDFPGGDPLAGVELQRTWERAAFRLGGGDFRAPAQLVGDFLGGRASASLGGVLPSYRPGVTLCDLRECLPPFVSEALREALPLLDQRLRGFACPDAVLTGPETRSSSPVRLPRDPGGQSGIRGIFPAGEGAGYAGGITSAAVDGLRAAEQVARCVVEREG